MSVRESRKSLATCSHECLSVIFLFLFFIYSITGFLQLEFGESLQQLLGNRWLIVNVCLPQSLRASESVSVKAISKMPGKMVPTRGGGGKKGIIKNGAQKSVFS